MQFMISEKDENMITSRLEKIVKIAIAGIAALGMAAAGFSLDRYVLTKHYDDYQVIDCTGKMVYDDGDSFYCIDKRIKDFDRNKKDDGEEWVDDYGVRVLYIDTPEIIHESQGICIDQEHGQEAAAYAKHIFDTAKKIEVIPVKRDKYNRVLSHVLVDGELFGLKMVRAGLAYTSIEHYGDEGFPEFAIQTLEAWSQVPKPLPFEEPRTWRELNQHKDGTGCE